MIQFILDEQLIKSLSDSTLDKLSNNSLYNESLLKANLIKISEYFSRGDAKSLYLLHHELESNEKKCTTEFNQTFSVLNNIHFKLKDEVLNELIIQYQNDESLDKNVEFYKGLENSLLNRLNKFFQSEVALEEKNINTYKILSCLIFELLGSLNLNDIYLLRT